MRMDKPEEYAELPEGVAVVLQQRETWEEPPADLQDAVRAALLRARSSTASEDLSRPPTTPTDASEVAVGDDLAAARHRRAERSSGEWRWPRLLLVAAAVVGVAAVGTAVAVSQAGPESTVVALMPTEQEPSASGTAAISDTPSGFSIELDLEGLPPAAEGSYYQAWLKNAEGELVTIGTFHARDGSDDVILWSGVDPADYPTLTVTLQREGEGPQSSGQVVLVGTLG